MNMIDKRTAAKVRGELDRLDLSDLEQRLADLQTAHDTAEMAEQRARERMVELNRLIGEFRQVDGDTIAEALIAGEETGAAVRSATRLEDLTEERAGLVEATSRLRRKQDDLRSQMKAVRREATEIAGAIVGPLSEAIRAEASAAAERIVEAYAALAAIDLATGERRPQTQELGEVIHALETALGRRQPQRLPVPAGIPSLLAPLREHGLLRGQSVETIAKPEYTPNTMPIAVAAELGRQMRQRQAH